MGLMNKAASAEPSSDPSNKEIPPTTSYKAARQTISKQLFLRKFRFLFQDPSIVPEHIDMVRHGRLENLLRYTDFIGELLRSKNESQLFRYMTAFLLKTINLSSIAIFQRTNDSFVLKESEGFNLENSLSYSLKTSLIRYISKEDNLYSRHMLLANGAERSTIEAHNIQYILPIFVNKECELFLMLGETKKNRSIPINDVILLRIIGLAIGRIYPFISSQLIKNVAENQLNSMQALINQFSDFLLSRSHNAQSQAEALTGTLFEDFQLPVFMSIFANQDGSDNEALSWGLHENDTSFFKEKAPAFIQKHDEESTGSLQKLISSLDDMDPSFQVPKQLQSFCYVKNKEGYHAFLFAESFDHLNAFEFAILNMYMTLFLEHYSLSLLKEKLSGKSDLENPARHLHAYLLDCEERLEQGEKSYSLISLEFTNMYRITKLDEDLNVRKLIDLIHQFLSDSFPEAALISRLGLDRFYIFQFSTTSLKLNQAFATLESLLESEFPHSGARPLYKKEIINRPEHSQSEVFRFFP